MSFREEDNQKNCPSRGLGLAAAAIGVGVGAALYYFFGKRSENPTPSGSTAEDWHCETEHSFLEDSGSSDNSYTTLSEHTTTDSSIVEDNENFCNCNNISTNNESDSETDSESDPETDSESDPETDSGSDPETDSESDSETDSEFDSEYSYASDDSNSTPLSSSIRSNNESQDLISSLNNIDDNALSMTDLMDWDVTFTLDVPSFTSNPNNRVNNIITSLFSPRRKKRNDTNSASAQVFRKRSKTLEQCSICFDIILRDQESMVLPCTHFFHTSCILPWLQEQQTCPNCRNAVD